MNAHVDKAIAAGIPEEVVQDLLPARSPTSRPTTSAPITNFAMEALENHFVSEKTFNEAGGLCAAALTDLIVGRLFLDAADLFEQRRGRSAARSQAAVCQRQGLQEDGVSPAPALNRSRVRPVVTPASGAWSS